MSRSKPNLLLHETDTPSHTIHVMRKNIIFYLCSTSVLPLFFLHPNSVLTPFYLNANSVEPPS